ncbi:hypothetical protein T310_10154, partial [Rasamsonia emersonii CBS 393.64]
RYYYYGVTSGRQILQNTSSVLSLSLPADWSAAGHDYRRRHNDCPGRIHTISYSSDRPPEGICHGSGVLGRISLPALKERVCLQHHSGRMLVRQAQGLAVTGMQRLQVTVLTQTISLTTLRKKQRQV